jgi:UDP-N-acetylmuramyl pentapeptide phosphotransferase/UDP-N-acetylglucosamine-1-phosphate transferase
MSALVIALLCLAVAAAAAAATAALVPLLTRKGVVGEVTTRSSHLTPTPRGGGLGILVAVVPAWVLIASESGVAWGPAGILGLAGLLLAAAVSLKDDLATARGGVRKRWRFAVQVLAVLFGLTFLAPNILYAGTSETLFGVILTGVVLALLWICYVNAVNFMDGIDGLAATHAIGVAGGAAVCFWLNGAQWPLIAISATLAAGALGFLALNRPPARIFLGDVGSIPLGLMLGFLLVILATQGAWGAALILPAYFGADAALTFLRRWRKARAGALRDADGQPTKLTSAHREHAYQRAAGRLAPEDTGKRAHARVVLRVAVTQAALILAACAGLLIEPWTGYALGQWLTAIIGALLVLHLLRDLERMARERAA